MINTEVQPAHIINRYVYDLLRVNLPASAGWDRSNYGGMTPIVLAHQEPKILSYNRPFIVYGYAEDTTTRQPTKGGSVAYTLWGTDTRLLGDMETTISEALGREDDSARDLNEYSSHISAFHGIRFLHTSVATAESPGAPETEGGNQGGIIIVRYRCVADYNVKTSGFVPG